MVVLAPMYGLLKSTLEEAAVSALLRIGSSVACKVSDRGADGGVDIG